MPSKIDQNLIPAVIRESVDPEILNRARSIEWSINRDTGEDEHGFLDGSHEDYLSSQNLISKSHGFHDDSTGSQSRKARKIEWFDGQTSSTGRDSGIEYTPTSPALSNAGRQQSNSMRSVSSSSYSLDTQHQQQQQQRVDLSPFEDLTNRSSGRDVVAGQSATGSMKRHPQGQRPFPIYKTNQEQLDGDVVFEVAPRAKPGERTVHYEKSTNVLNEQEMNALGLDPNFFGPNSKTMVDEQEEELIETSVLKGGRRELEDLCRSMRTHEAGDYFESRQRARSLSPSGRASVADENSAERKVVLFGSVEELNTREQEFYPYRDAHNGKPLPGDNEYGTWGSRYDDQKQWKLCNGQWIRVAEPKPKLEKYMAERVKCKPPKEVEVARVEPVRTVLPQSGTDSSDSEADSDDYLDEPNSLDASLDGRKPDRFRVIRAPAVEEPDVDLDALRDKYRPKSAASSELPAADNRGPKLDDGGRLGKPEKPIEKLNDTKPLLLAEHPPSDHENDDHDDAADQNTGTILLEPIEPPMEEIKVEPIQPTYVEMKKPLKMPEGEEEKMMEDPNLMWMRMGPAQYGPPFGSLGRRKAREEEWYGPPCELCHKQIEERRCMLAENMKFHCWHFACSFCLKTLKPADFLIAEANRKPYCLNCHKREFPEISLVNLNLEAK